MFLSLLMVSGFTFANFNDFDEIATYFDNSVIALLGFILVGV